jgi:hypothetical protein
MHFEKSLALNRSKIYLSVIMFVTILSYSNVSIHKLSKIYQQIILFSIILQQNQIYYGSCAHIDIPNTASIVY